MINNSERTAIAALYEKFARNEARGVSEIYERLALGVAGHSDVLDFIAALPAEKRQPNLVFAAVRLEQGVPDDANDMAAMIARASERIRATILKRRTQTNEPARTAVLLPVLCGLPQPLALVEVGASAGLCLLPDRYCFRYGAVTLNPAAPLPTPPPMFDCRMEGPVPVPAALPEVIWRRGLDLDPVDLSRPDDVAWLQTLVWPEQTERAAHLDAAIEAAHVNPPEVVRGDLAADLDALLAAAPRHATLVVFHTAVLSYVQPQSARARFAERLLAGPAVWVSNEAPGVFPDIAATAPPPPEPGLFLLAVNGRPVAWTRPHGQGIIWFAD